MCVHIEFFKISLGLTVNSTKNPQIYRKVRFFFVRIHRRPELKLCIRSNSLTHLKTWLQIHPPRTNSRFGPVGIFTLAAEGFSRRLRKLMAHTPWLQAGKTKKKHL